MTLKTIANNTDWVACLVSIIVPIYNSKEYIHRCIKSIVEQTYKNIEVILVNDGSTDNSGETCNQYALGDNRIRVIHTQNNGPAAARNVGIENSKGEFIFFVDSDDFIESNALNLLIDNYNQHKPDIIVGDFRTIKEDNYGPGHKGVFSDNTLLSKQDIIDYARCYLKKPNKFTLFAYSWGRLFKSSIIKDNNILFNTDLHTFEDVAFNFEYLKFTNEVYFSKEAIYNHLIHDNYMSATMMVSDNPKRMFGYSQALAAIGIFLRDCNSDADIKKEVGHANICLTIIQFVRICGQINNSNRKRIYELVCKTVNDPNLRGNLKYYSPTKGDSRILPVLMKLKLILPIIWICKYKAQKRYGKAVAAK